MSIERESKVNLTELGRSRVKNVKDRSNGKKSVTVTFVSTINGSYFRQSF